MNTFRLKRRKVYYDLPLILLINGIRDVKEVLLELHSEYTEVIKRVHSTILGSIRALRSRDIPSTVVTHAKPKANLLIDKGIFEDTRNLIGIWLQVSVIDLVGNEKQFYPFWNSRCDEVSTTLWFPTHTDSVATLSGIFNVERTINPNCPSEPVTESVVESMACRKIRIFPNQEQQKILLRWMGTSRYVYNRALKAIREGHKINFQELRNKYVTYKNNPNIAEWEIETPKDIRAGAIRDLCKAYKTAFTNLSRGNIRRFQMQYRRKKQSSSMEILKTAVKLTAQGLTIYPKYLKDPIKFSKDKYLKDLVINHACRLMNNKGEWYLCVPVKASSTLNPQFNVCALDPGVRAFQTIYSQYETISVKVDTDSLKRSQEKISMFQALKIKKSHKERRIQKIYTKIHNQVENMQNSIACYLARTYRTIYIPSFDTQELVKKNKYKSVRRNLNLLGHYRFKQKLLNKSKGTIVCTEEYTSKTCGVCGKLTNVGRSEVFKCEHCGLVVNRDINGARNILIKNIT